MFVPHRGNMPSLPVMGITLICPVSVENMILVEYAPEGKNACSVSGVAFSVE
jgi:hypothetical protein